MLPAMRLLLDFLITLLMHPLLLVLPVDAVTSLLLCTFNNTTPSAAYSYSW